VKELKFLALRGDDLINRVPDEDPTPPYPSELLLRQVDQSRTDFAILEEHLEFLMHQMAQLPTYQQLAKLALLLTFVAAVLGIVGIEALWHYFPACGSN
jgi:hypothetical protein